jgi:hypothetical protein
MGDIGEGSERGEVEGATRLEASREAGRRYDRGWIKRLSPLDLTRRRRPTPPTFANRGAGGLPRARIA